MMWLDSTFKSPAMRSIYWLMSRIRISESVVPMTAVMLKIVLISSEMTGICELTAEMMEPYKTANKIMRISESDL